MSIKCGHCHQRHETVADVRACALPEPYPTQSNGGWPPAGGLPRTAAKQPHGREATQAQVDFIAKLAARKGVPVPTSSSKSEASANIDRLKALPDAPTASTAADATHAQPQAASMTDIGVYVLEDGTIVRVQKAKTSDRRYAKKWIEISGERIVDATGEYVQGEWEYAPGLVYQCTPERKMSLEAAKAFILRYGKCCRCGRRLKAAKSVEQGIGPVCIQYFGAFEVAGA